MNTIMAITNLLGKILELKKMKKYIITIILLLINITFYINLSAQDITQEWYLQIAGKNNEKAGKIRHDKNMSLYYSVTFEDSAQILNNGSQLYTTVYSYGYSDILLGKTDREGEPKWINQIGGTGIDLSPDLIVDKDGNSILAGSFQYSVHFNSDSIVSEDFIDSFIAKYDSLGSLIWKRQISGRKNNQISSLSFDRDGNVLICGFYNGTNKFFNNSQTELTTLGGFNSYLMKLDVNGNHLWTKAISSKKDVIAKEIICDLANNYYITGSYSDTLYIDDSTASPLFKKGTDVFLTKLTSNGELKWIKTFGGQGNDIGKTLSFKNNIRLIVSGEYNKDLFFESSLILSSEGSQDIFRLAFNRKGELLHAKNKGQKRNDFIYENNRTPNSKFLKVTDIKITDTSNNQNLLFNNRITLIVADTSDLISETLVVSEGMNPKVHSATMNRNNDTYYLASFTNTLSLSSFTLSSKGGDDVFIFGVVNEIDSLKSTQSDQNESDFEDQDYIDFSDSDETDPQISCYPNPYTASTKIYCTIYEYSNVDIRIIDITGNLIFEKNFMNQSPGSHSYTLNDLNLQAGIYPCTITIKDENQQYTEIIKLVQIR